MEPRAVLVSLEGQQEAGYFPGLPGSQHSQSGSMGPPAPTWVALGKLLRPCV